MARILRSGRILKNSPEKELEQSELRESSPENLNLDLSFGLPAPGPLTQAIIDDLAGSESTMQVLDDIIENDFLLFSPKKQTMPPLKPPKVVRRYPPKNRRPNKGPQRYRRNKKQ